MYERYSKIVDILKSALNDKTVLKLTLDKSTPIYEISFNRVLDGVQKSINIAKMGEHESLFVEIDERTGIRVYEGKFQLHQNGATYWFEPEEIEKVLLV